MTFIVFIGLASQKEKRKPVAAQSEIGNFRRLQLKLQFVCNQRNKFGIRGFSLGIADGIAEKSLQSIQVTSVPGHFDGVADSPLHSAWGGLECFRHLGGNTLVMALITSMSLTAMIHRDVYGVNALMFIKLLLYIAKTGNRCKCQWWQPRLPILKKKNASSIFGEGELLERRTCPA